MENNPTSMRFPITTYMLLWFTNPDKRLNDGLGGDGLYEQGLCSQFYISLEDAERSAELLSGSRIILMCTAQNPSPSNNVYWDVVKKYGESFELSELTIMSEDMRQAFIKRENNK
jgi:hypothetical protein